MAKYSNTMYYMNRDHLLSVGQKIKKITSLEFMQKTPNYTISSKQGHQCPSGEDHLMLFTHIAHNHQQ